MRERKRVRQPNGSLVGRVLVVEDDPGLRDSVVQALRLAGHAVDEATGLGDARSALQRRAFDIVLVDNQLADGFGTSLIEEILELDPGTGVIVMTAYAELRVAIEAMRNGARDFIVKPFELADLEAAIRRLLDDQAVRREVRRLRRERKPVDVADGVPGESDAVVRLNTEIARVATVDTPVLVVGETGTGKELVSTAIHAQSPRANGPLVTVNCSAFSDQLLESELFGHQKGAFTGATETREGVFEMANGGTLFLDEIAELKPELQAKLLRVVEGHPFRRLGGKREISTDVRLVAATNRDLRQAIADGLFREDLYFRLAAFPIDVPPLRDRGRDVLQLARRFLRQFCTTSSRRIPDLTEATERALLDHDWPGNVRELRNVIERAAILCHGPVIDTEHLPGPGRRVPTGGASQAWGAAEEDLVTMADVERAYIRHVLAIVNGNQSKAARILGIARNTLRARLDD